MKEIYFSQYKQDFILDKVIFKDKKGKVFFDIGANDGITYSNTYFLEKNLGWTGVCVEPLPMTFKKLEDNRNCILENCAVGSSSRTETFIEVTGYAEMLSGIKRNYDKRHINRIDSEIKTYGGSKREIELKIVNVNELLDKHSLHNIDFCSIDTEGSEFQILRVLEFDRFKINVLTVEANYQIDRLKIRGYLFLKGYTYIVSLGGDMLFIHNRFLKGLEPVQKIMEDIKKIKSL